MIPSGLGKDMLKFKEDTKLHSEWMEMSLGRGSRGFWVENPWRNPVGKRISTQCRVFLQVEQVAVHPIDEGFQSILTEWVAPRNVKPVHQEEVEMLRLRCAYVEYDLQYMTLQLLYIIKHNMCVCTV